MVLRLIFALLTLALPARAKTVVEPQDASPEAWKAFGQTSQAASRNSRNSTETNEATSSAWNFTQNPMIQQVAQDVAYMYSELTNPTENSTQMKPLTETYSWNLGATLCAALLVLVPACCCGFCAAINCWVFSKIPKDYEGLEHGLQAAQDGTSTDTEEDASPSCNCRTGWAARPWNFGELREVLHREVLLMLTCPLLTLLAAPWTTCEEGSPSWVYVVQTLACDMQGLQITERWASAWASSSAAWFAPVVQVFHVSGLVFLVFCVGAAVQQLLGALFREARGEPILADLAGMHGLALLRGRAEEDPAWANSWRLIVVGFSKVALENVPQLLLQSSFFALVFDELTSLGRAKVLFSILLGLLSGSQKIWEATREMVRQICREGAQYDCGGWCFWFIILVLFVLASLAVLWTVCKLYFVFHCDTHLWNLGSGCVE
eukprot:Skav208012  [mRNA]  locus=scaffold320:111847:113816:- [translate_table: standard]